MKKINRDAISQIIILGVTIFLILYGLVSKTMNKYVHPRFNIGLWLSVLVLLIFLISIMRDNTQGRHNSSYQRYLIYLLPLVVALLFKPVAISNTEMVLADRLSSEDKKESKEREQMGQDEANYSNVDEYLRATNEQQENQDSSGQQETSKQQDGGKAADASDIYQAKEAGGYYIIGDDEFADWFMDLYEHTDDFIGEKYQFLAQVFTMDDLSENQFLAGRNFMVCCAADLVGYGLICESDIRKELQENQWIIVKATISECEYEENEVPMLVDTEIEATEAPKVEYIYYNSY